MTVPAQTKAEILFEALPYLRAWRGRTVVVKLGGEALADASLASLVAQDIALLTLVGIRVAIVHGGGPQVTAAMDAAGIEARFVDGLRVTDDVTVEIVRGVLVGTINAQLVQQLNNAGVRAVGLHGGDGGLVVVRCREPELGRVGAVDRVDPSVIRTLLDEGYTPAIAPVAPDANGVTHNVNADSIAGGIAAALGAEKLVFLTNVPGLYRDLGDAGSLVSELKSDELRELSSTLSDGMRPKALAALDALDRGVAKVHILDGRTPHALLLEIFTDQGIGTMVLP